MRFFLTTILLLPLAGCVSTQQSTEPAGTESSRLVTHSTIEAEHRERVEEAWRNYEAALLVGDAERALAMYSEDITIRGSSTLQGRAAYRDRVESFLSSTSLEYLKGEVEDVIVMGDHVFVAGTWSERFQRKVSDESVSLRGAYAWLWRLEEDGEWRIYQYIWNVRSDPES